MFQKRREHKYAPGKIDFHGTGHATHLTEITWSLENGRFSMSAGVWTPRRNDYEMCGQCVDEIAAYFPEDAKLQRMLVVWKRWHLNDMNAGSPAQMAHLRTIKISHGDHYTKACAALSDAGLNPDPTYLLHDGKPYNYGSAWLREELPADVVAEIEGWSA